MIDILARAKSTARELAAGGRLKDAAGVLEGALSDFPLAVRERYLLGVARIAVGDHDDGRREIQRSLIVDPEESLHWHQLGQLHLQLGQGDLAARQWWRAYHRAPDNRRVLSDLLKLTRRSGGLSLSRLQGLHARVTSSGDILLFRMLADLVTRYGTRENHLVFTISTQAVIESPGNTNIYRFLGEDGNSLLPPTIRQALLARALKCGSLNPRVFSSLANYALQRERYDLAEGFYQRNIIVDPMQSESYHRLYFISKFRRAAKEQYAHLRRSFCAWSLKANSPDIADVLNETASVLRLMGDSRRVIGDIRKALSYSGLTSTSRAKLTRQLALCQIESGDLRESLENLERVQQVKPNQPSTYLLSDWAGYHYRAKNREAYHYLNNPNFIKKYDIEEVVGDLNIREFNTALRDRVANHPTLQVLYKGARGGYSQTRDRGPGSLLADPAPELARLRHCFEQLFERYRAALPDDLDHPFLKLKDTSIRLSIFWGLILKDCTSSPTHRHGDDIFATAIYYPNEDVDQGDPGDPRAGWFEAMRLDLNIEMERSDILEFEPTPGRFIFLPAYFYHRALPMMSPKSRTSIVADFQFHPE